MSDEVLQEARRRFFAYRFFSLFIFLVAMVLVKASTFDCILRQKIGIDWMLCIGIWLAFFAGILWGKPTVLPEPTRADQRKGAAQ
jgi:hypothetical protein